MNLTAIVLAATVYLDNCGPFHKEVNDYKYPKIIEYEKNNGEKITIDLEQEPDKGILQQLTRNAEYNRYLLYTSYPEGVARLLAKAVGQIAFKRTKLHNRTKAFKEERTMAADMPRSSRPRNPKFYQTLTVNNAESVRNSNFNPSVPTVVIVHGWCGSLYSDLNPAIRDAYLGKADVNVIVMDWSTAASSNYPTAVHLVPFIGRSLGQFVNFLSQVTGVPLNSFHLVGFSLGAHIVGNAGRETGGRVARVTGLDPAGPLWNHNSQRLGPNDGIYVEAIHTDGGYLLGGFGIGSAIANADFFPNGGTSQPGCLTHECNHDFAWKLFAATVSYDHLVGRECTSMLEVISNLCRGIHFKMGNDDLKKSGYGIYRLDTGRIYPY